MTREQAMALLDEAESLLPGPGQGLPSFQASRRLEEIANAFLTDAPMALDRIVMRASAIRNVAHRWSIPARLGPVGTEERSKWLVRRDLDDLRSTLARCETDDVYNPTTRLGWLTERLGGWLQP